MKSFASKHPVGFGLAASLLHILIVLVSAILGNTWPGEAYRPYIGGTVGRLAFITILLVVLARLGWLGPAGFRRPASWQAWPAILLPLAYSTGVSAYAMTRNFDFRLPDASLTGIVALFILSAAFLEEAVFRGLVLHVLVNAWGGSRAGMVRSVLAASLLFAGIHLVNFLGGQPWLEVLLQSLVAISLGIYLGALVLRGSSLYPAILFHAILNFTGYVNLSNNAAGQTPSSWLLLSLWMLPLAVYGMVLLRDVSQRARVLHLERI